MLGIAERRRSMDSSQTHRRITVAVQADRLFETYEIEMSPGEALSFVSAASTEAHAQLIYVFLDLINQTIPTADFGPGHPRTGTAHHVYRVGRRHGNRLIILEFFKGYFPRPYPFDDLAERISQYAAKAGCAIEDEADETIQRYTFVWDHGAAR